jgi:hypothetical protein
MADLPYPEIPDVALSIQQPWSFLITYGLKPIENRSWSTPRRGPIAIHAGKNFDPDAFNDVINGFHPVTGEPFRVMPHLARDFQRMVDGQYCGGIVGFADLVDVVSSSDNEWFVGKYGFVLANARPVPFIPVRGMQGFFPWRKQLTPDQLAEAA